MKTFSQWLEASIDQVAVMVPIFEGKALILRRGATAPWKPGTWNLPGGHVDPGETPYQAAIRECDEEAGLRVSNVKAISQYPEEDFVIFAFTGIANTNNVVLRPTHGIMENDTWEWVSEQQLGEYNFAIPVVRTIIMRALAPSSNG